MQVEREIIPVSHSIVRNERRYGVLSLERVNLLFECESGVVMIERTRTFSSRFSDNLLLTKNVVSIYVPCINNESHVLLNPRSKAKLCATPH